MPNGLFRSRSYKSLGHVGLTVAVGVAQDFDLILHDSPQQRCRHWAHEEKSRIAKCFGVQFDFKTGQHAKAAHRLAIDDRRPLIDKCLNSAEANPRR